MVRRGRWITVALEGLRTQPEIFRKEHAKDEVPRTHSREIECGRIILSTCVKNQPDQHSSYTHAKGVPHAREWLRDDVEHAHAAVQERNVVVAHVAEAVVRRAALAEEAPAEYRGVEDPRCAQARLGIDESVEEPGGVREVRAHAWVGRAEEVEQNEVLDGGELCDWRRGREQTAFWMRGEVGSRPGFGEVAVSGAYVSGW